MRGVGYQKKFILLFTGIVFSILNLTICSYAQSEEVGEDSYKLLIYFENTIYEMNPDGSNRRALLDRQNVIDFIPLSDGRIFIHSKQYDGNALEIFEPETGVWVLVEFSEGEFPNIAVSDDGSIVAYEVRHQPTSMKGDGVWIFKAEGSKAHIKVSGSALSIESISLFDERVYVLYYELDLISDDAGLFLESFPLNKSAKSRRNPVQEGMKKLLKGGYYFGYEYPSSGKQLVLKELLSGDKYSIDAPSGDIILDEKSFHHGDKPLLVYNLWNIDVIVGDEYSTHIWYIAENYVEDIEFGGKTDAGIFRFSPDGWLYFCARMIDRSGEKSGLMLFRKSPTLETTELVSVHGGQVAFTYQ